MKWLMSSVTRIKTLCSWVTLIIGICSGPRLMTMVPLQMKHYSFIIPWKITFFTQHVECCTRNDAILDLVITDEPYMVNNMVDLGPFKCRWWRNSWMYMLDVFDTTFAAPSVWSSIDAWWHLQGTFITIFIPHRLHRPNKCWVENCKNWVA